MESYCYCLSEQGNPPVAQFLGYLHIVCQCAAALCARAGSPCSLCLHSSELLVNAKKSDAAPASESRACVISYATLVPPQSE